MARLSDPQGAFARLKSTVEHTATVGAQLNEVARFLAGHGYAKSHDPVGRETWAASKPGERPAKLQFYVWLDTPFGDDLVLSTGPSFKPALALGSTIPKDPGVGIYVASMLSGLKPDTKSAMQRAEARGPRRQETFSEAKARRESEARPAAKPRAPVSPPKPKGPTPEELAALAYAEGQKKSRKSAARTAQDIEALARADREASKAALASDRAAVAAGEAAVREAAKRAKWKADEEREAAAEKARVAKSMAAARAHNEMVEREKAERITAEAKRAEAQAKAEAERVAREAKAAGESKVAATAKAAAAEAADFLKFLEEAAGE